LPNFQSPWISVAGVSASAATSGAGAAVASAVQPPGRARGTGSSCPAAASRTDVAGVSAVYRLPGGSSPYVSEKSQNAACIAAM
jgi:hypothetical protein